VNKITMITIVCISIIIIVLWLGNKIPTIIWDILTAMAIIMIGAAGIYLMARVLKGGNSFNGG